MKKITAMVLALFMSISLYPMKAQASEQGIIHSQIDETRIAKNAIYKNIVRFTEGGWQNIHVIQADVSGPGAGLRLLTPVEGIGSGDYLEQMVPNREVVAAINGDFFLSGEAYSPIGPVVKDGKMQSSPTYRTEELAVFSLDRDNIPFIDYWKWDIKMRLRDIELSIAAINKISFDYAYPVVFTPVWGPRAPRAAFEDILYVIIDKNRIQALLAGPQQEVEIPDAGMVLMARGETAASLQQACSPGDRVRLEIESQPDYSALKLAVGGGCILIRDGKIVPFTHLIDGYHPRSALGFTRDGKSLIAVTVEGRNKPFAGMTQQQLAALMMDLGAYNAINLDGGGSSTMLARRPGDNAPSLVNTPSDGQQRRISNGLGIVNDAPRGSLRYIFLETADPKVFLGTGRTIVVKGCDGNYNPVPIDKKNVSWKVSGVEGGFSGNVFYPAEVGNATITASYGGRSANMDLRVLEPPLKLAAQHRHLKMDTGNIIPFNVYGKNLSGFSALIENRDLQLESSIGRIEGQSFLSGDREGSGELTVRLGQMLAVSRVSVGYSRIVLDDFERPNGSFSSYPQEEVSGHYVLDITHSVSGRSSGRIAYDFTAANGTAASYLVFDGNGIRLDTLPARIGVHVYSPKENNHWLRAIVEDAEGKSVTLDLARKIDWKGTEFVDTALPQDLKLPIFIKRIYVVETNPIMHDAGKILLDDLTALYPHSSEQDFAVPEETEIPDPAKVDAPPESRSFAFSLFGSTEKNRLLDIHVVDRMKKLARDGGQLAVFAGSVGSDSLSGIEIPVIATQPGYASVKYGINTFIKLDNHSAGLRTYSPQQWHWLKQQLGGLRGENLFLILPRPVWGEQGFADVKEAELLHSYLADLYIDKDVKVYVLYGKTGDPHYDIRDGVKYMGIGGTQLETEEYSLFDSFSYIRFYVDREGNVSYQIMPLFER